MDVSNDGDIKIARGTIVCSFLHRPGTGKLGNAEAHEANIVFRLNNL